MDVLQWCYEHIAVPSSPSQEVRDYVKKEYTTVLRIERFLNEEYCLIDSERVENIEEIEQNLRDRQDVIVAFERMYPGLLANELKVF